MSAPGRRVGKPPSRLDVPFFAIEPVGSASATVKIDVSAVRGRKADALRAHRTQVTVQGDHYALSSGPSLPIGTAEAFRLVPTALADSCRGSTAGRGERSCSRRSP